MRRDFVFAGVVCFALTAPLAASAARLHLQRVGLDEADPSATPVAAPTATGVVPPVVRRARALRPLVRDDATDLGTRPDPVEFLDLGNPWEAQQSQSAAPPWEPRMRREPRAQLDLRDPWSDAQLAAPVRAVALAVDKADPWR